MATIITVGDAVKPNRHLRSIEMTPAQPIQETYWLMSPHRDSKVKKPYRIFGSLVGIYMGEARVPQRDRRATSNISLKLYHKFFFGGRLVLIDPTYVDIVSEISKAEG